MVAKSDKLAARGADTAVARRGRTLIFLVELLDSQIEVSHHPAGGVAGTVVDDDHFKIAKGLIGDAFECLGQKSCAVEGGNYNGNGRHFGRERHP